MPSGNDSNSLQVAMSNCGAMVKSGVWKITQHLVADLAPLVHRP